MLVRLVIWISLACVGFAGGRVCFRGKELAAGLGEKTSLASWAATQPTALAGGVAGAASSESERAIEEVRRVAGLDLGAAMLGYLRVVGETPLDELEALLTASEKTMPKTDMGGVGVLMRDAIVDRLMAEDPDRLLLMVVANKSSHLSDQTHSMMAEFLEFMGFDAVKAALAETQYPLGAARAMQMMLGGIDDRPLRMERALEYGRLDVKRHLVDTDPKAVTDLILSGDASPEFNPSFVSQSFHNLYVLFPETAQSKLASIRHAAHRQAALEGIAHAWKGAVFAGAIQFAEGLESDQMRLAFLRAALPSETRRTDPFGEKVLVVAANSEALGKILQLDQGPVRQTLMEETLRSWKRAEPEQARVWSEANGVLATFEKMIANPRVPLRTNAIDGLLYPPADDEG